MNKITTFLIVAVLVARGLIYIYDHNKNKSDNLVSQANPISLEVAVNTDRSDSSANVTDLKTVSATAVTFLLTDNTEIYYYVGAFDGNLYTIDYNYVGVFIKAYKDAIDPDDLMFIIKSDKSATFKNVIDLLDEMSKNEVPPGHYKEAEMSKEETDKIKLLKNTKNG